jgi:ABC-type Na+ efflux pump permease subunit
MQSMSLLSRDERTGQLTQAHKKGELEGFIVPFALMMLLAMMVLMSSAPMLGAVADDKQQRVFEMLLGSATPFELIMGKMLAAVALTMTSSIHHYLRLERPDAPTAPLFVSLKGPARGARMTPAGLRSLFRYHR